jgi:magnesium transporter
MDQSREAESAAAAAAERPGDTPPSLASLYGLTPALEEAVAAALEEDRPAEARRLARPLHPADLADLLERLSAEPRSKLVAAFGADFDPEAVAWLNEPVREEIVAQLGPDRLAKALAELETDDAMSILEDLEAREQREVLDAVPAGDRALLEQGLDFPEDSAGRLMQRQLVAVPPHWTAGQTIDFMRSGAACPRPSPRSSSSTRGTGRSGRSRRRGCCAPSGRCGSPRSCRRSSSRSRRPPTRRTSPTSSASTRWSRHRWSASKVG